MLKDLYYGQAVQKVLKDSAELKPACLSELAGVESRTSMKTLYLLRHAKSSWDDRASDGL